ncbi:MAG: tail fiber domain-containing protein [Bacteroidales bacterium]|nr:tail fiber domain-containing protein [Bacteroidales bacterium]
MKKLFTSALFVLFLLITSSVFCQSLQSFKYQSVVRDNAGDIIQNQLIGIRISIHDVSALGTTIYRETFTETTNSYGLISLEIGKGTPDVGTFVSIDWGSNPKFLETEIDVTGGTSFVSMGTSELVSVPYALYSGATGDTSTWRKNGNKIYYSSGNVGIGTQDPLLNLHVFGSGLFKAGDAGLSISPGSNFGVLAYNGTSGISVNTRFYWGKTEFLGNVGIGTSNPTNLLELSSVSPKLYFNHGSSTSNLSGLYWRSDADSFEGAFVRDNGTGAFELYSNISGGVPRMKITDEGEVGIGTEYPNSTLSVGGSGESYATISSLASTASYSTGIYSNSTGYHGTGVIGNASGNEGVGVKGYCYSSAGSGVEGFGWTAGTTYDFNATGAGVNYGSTSSKRWKSNIIEIENPLEKLFKLRGVYFDWDEEHGGGHDVGCIAEEVGKVLPEIVVYEENGIDADGMDYSKLTPLLIEAVKEQQQIIKELEDRIKNLEIANKNH